MLEVSKARSLIQIQGASHVAFKGLVLEECTGTAVQVSGGEDVSFDSCVVRDAGNRAFELQGLRHRVQNSEITDTGEGAVWIDGGDRQHLSPGEIKVINTHISRFGILDHASQAAVGIWIQGVGDEVARCKIEDGPFQAIYFKGNDHLVAYNEVAHVCTEVGDAGAIYCGRDWTAQGNRIEYNYIHDVQGPGALGTKGIYLDDQACGTMVTGNVFLRVPEAVFIHAGSDNVIRGNLFLRCSPPIRVVPQVGNQGMDSQLRDSAKGVPLELYKARYPALARVLVQTPGEPLRNLVSGNIMLGCTFVATDPGARRLDLERTNVMDGDWGIPTEVLTDSASDLKKIGFTIRRDCPAFQQGFSLPSIQQMGLDSEARRMIDTMAR